MSEIVLSCQGLKKTYQGPAPVEVLRGDPRGSFLGGTLSTAQLVSLPLGLWGLLLLRKARRAAPGAPE